MRDWMKIHPLPGLIILGTALTGAILRYGFPPSEGWLKFIGALILFAGITYAACFPIGILEKIRYFPARVILALFNRSVLKKGESVWRSTRI